MERKEMNAAVTTLATDNLSYQKEIFKNRREYCSMNGYTFCSYKKTLDNRPATWSKLKVMLDIFETEVFDWVLWVDSDAVIVNNNIKIEDLIDDDFDLLITEDCFTYNAGVFLMKNTEASKRFLQECVDKEYHVGHPWEDQAAWVEVLENNDYYKVKTLPQRSINSYPKQEPREGWYTSVNEKMYHWDSKRSEAGEYEEGDFIIHFAGLSGEEKSKSIFSLLKEKNICMLSYATPDIDFYAKRIFSSNKAYAKKHNYDWQEHWETLDKARPPAWSKILYILKALEEGYDWVFWIDADAIIMNDSIELEKFIDNDYDFILCKDAFSWNTGAWFIKNSKKAKELLKQTYAAEEYTDAFLWEQGAFMNTAYNNGIRIKVHKQREFNSVAPQTKQFFAEGNEYECGTFKFVLDMEEYDKGMYKDGDFVLHFASINHEGRNMLLKEFRPDLYE